MIDEQHAALVEEVGDLYDEAERDLKAVGRVTNSLLVTGVNQCRYAGQHVVRALRVCDSAAAKEELGAAKRHLQRAIFDTNDAGIQFYLTEIDKFRRSPVDWQAILPDYDKVVRAVRNADKHIEEASASHSSRTKLYAEVKQDLQSLGVAYETFLAYWPEAEKQTRRRAVVRLTTWLAIAATFTSAAVLALVNLM